MPAAATLEDIEALLPAQLDPAILEPVPQIPIADCDGPGGTIPYTMRWARDACNHEDARAHTDRLMYHAHLLKFEGKSWRLKEAATRVARRSRSE